MYSYLVSNSNYAYSNSNENDVVFELGWKQRRRTKRSKENRDLLSWQRVKLIT